MLTRLSKAQCNVITSVPLCFQPLFFASNADEDSCSTDVPVAQQDGRHEGNHQTSGPTAHEPQAHCRQPDNRDTETLGSAYTQSVPGTVSEAASQPSFSDTTYSQGARSAVGTDIFHSQDHAPDTECCADCGRDSDAVHSSHQRQDGRSEAVLPECIVCQNQPLNCVLLPCRHTCVCRMCFEKLDRCPMCRSHIESFFILTKEDDIPAASVPVEPLPMDLYSRFERFSRRLNEFLGFE